MFPYLCLFPLRVFTTLSENINPNVQNKNGCIHVLKLTRLIIQIIAPIVSMLKNSLFFIVFTKIPF
ncbi:hypothetical protein COM35_18905 [Bacillus toyonensis]|nr:hypothetical protein COM35_18905 [Bacillus toyonensis]